MDQATFGLINKNIFGKYPVYNTRKNTINKKKLTGILKNKYSNS